MAKLDFTLSYLRLIFPDSKNYRQNQKLFECPVCHTIGCRFIPNTDNTMFCVKCHNIGDIFNVMEKIKNMTKTEVIADIKTKLNLDIQDEHRTDILMDFFVRNGFDMVPISPREKFPIEQNWPNIEHKNKSEWQSWLSNGGNIGVKTGIRSNIIVVDVDTDEVPEILNNILVQNPTLYQKTAKGHHYFYQYDADIPSTRIDELKVDILSNGKQCLVEPSITDGIARKFGELVNIRPLPNALKVFLQNKVSIPVKTISEKLMDNDNLLEDIPKDMIEIKEGNRHNLFMRLGGIFRKELNSDQTGMVLSVLNKHFCNPSLSMREIDSIINSISKYIVFDEKETAFKIFNYLKLVDEATAKDIGGALELKSLIVSKCLHYLIREGYVFKKRNYYHAIKKAEWRQDFPTLDNAIKFEMPFFHDIAVINYGDMILLGAKPKVGKTQIAMNLLKSFVRQGLKPNYIALETGSRFLKVAVALGLREGDFNWTFHSDPTKIELDKDSVTVLDWLCVEDKSTMDAVLKHFTEQLYKTNGVLIVFTQLKQDNSWFAPNLITQFPALAARYMYDDENDGSKGKWKVDVIREAKSNRKEGVIPCVYDWTTKELKKVEDMQ